MTDNTKQQESSSNILKLTDESFIKFNFSEVDDSVDDNDIEELEFVLDFDRDEIDKENSIIGSGVIQGKVTGGEDGREPLEGINVIIYSGSGGFVSQIVSTITDTNGNYKFDSLLPGVYRILSNDPSMKYTPKFHRQKLPDQNLEGGQEPIEPIVVPGAFPNLFVLMSSDAQFRDDHLYCIELAEGQTINDVDVSLKFAGRIQGRVTAIDGITPLKDISVTAYKYMSMKMGLFHRDSQEIVRVKTDLDGNYDIGGLILGSYRIKFHDDCGRYSTQYYNNESHLRLAQEINVMEGEVKTGINTSLKIVIKGSIEGRVTDRNENPFEDSKVYVYPFYRDRNGKSPDAYTSPDSQGYYKIDNLMPGVYQVQFTTNVYNDPKSTCYKKESAVYYPDSIYITNGNTITNINISLDNTKEFEESDEFEESIQDTDIDNSLSQSGSIYGKVLNKQNEPLENIKVTLFVCDIESYDTVKDKNERIYNHNTSYPEWKEAESDIKTNADGVYEIDDVLPGIYRISFYEKSGKYIQAYYNSVSTDDYGIAENIHVAAEQKVTNNNVYLSLAGHIKGRIFEVSGKEITDGFTTIHTLRWNGSEWADFNHEVVDSCSYDIGGLPDGIYRVLFQNKLSSKYSCQYYNKQKTLELADDIHIKDGETVGGIDAYLSPKAVVKGRVTGPDGITPLQGIVVSAYSWNGYHWSCDNSTVTTDRNGNYTVEGIDTEICRVHFLDHDSGRYGTQFYNNKNIFESADDIVIHESNLVTNINASLSPAGMIEGTLTGIDGITPIKNMTVYILYYNGSRWIICDDYSGTNITDSEGHYKIIGLASGTYRLVFSNAGEFYNKKSSIDSADDIVVEEGRTIRINTSLKERYNDKRLW